MAYNPAMYNTYGQMYGNGFSQGPMGQPMQAMPQQSYAPPVTVKGEIEWVDGEVGAKAYQIPAGTTKPVALWDTNDTVIYLKSVNAYGIPNPLQKIHYRMEEQVPKYMGQSAQENLMSGDGKPGTEMAEYARKTDLEEMKREIMESLNQASGVSQTARKGTKAE